jgi:hypothetical protein
MPANTACADETSKKFFHDGELHKTSPAAFPIENSKAIAHSAKKEWTEFLQVGSGGSAENSDLKPLPAEWQGSSRR